jgi:hypothetical protein
MKHPFAIKDELSVEQINNVSAAGFEIPTKTYQEVDVKPKIIRPPVGSTMAIGEEGGSAQDIF